MANANVIQRAHNLFSMGVQYQITPGSDPEDLLNDASCVLGSAIGVLDANTDTMTQAHWGAYYLFEQAMGMVDAAANIIYMARLNGQPKENQVRVMDIDQGVTTCETSEGLTDAQQTAQRERLQATGGRFVIFPLAEQLARWKASVAGV